MRRSLPLYVMFALALAIVIGVGWGWYRSRIALHEADRWENHTYEVMLQANKLLSALTEAETSQRNFLLTGSEEHLQPFHQSVPRVDQALTAVKTLTKDKPRQQQRLNILEPLARARVASLKETVELRRTRGSEAAMQAVRTNRGISLMDEVRRQVGEFQAEEARLLREHRLAKEASLARTFHLGILGGIVSSVFVLMSFLGLKRQQGAVRASEIRYRRLFEAGHEGVLLLDTRSHQITDANPFIAALLGYSREELVGKELWQIGLLKDAKACRAAFAQLSRDGQVRYEDLPLQVKTRETREVEFVSNLYDEDGRAVIQCNIRDITQRKQAEAALREQTLMAQLRLDATQALQEESPLPDLLQSVAALLVARLDAAFTRVWTLDPTGQTLELHASAGLYTHLNGPHARIALGQFKIGRIAQRRQPLVTNEVIGDSHIPNQDWARREGLVAFAGFPLISEGRLLGVVALFARHRLSPAAVETFGAIAGTLAQALGRKQVQEALLKENEFFDTAINSLPGIFYLIDAQNHLRRWNKNFETVSGYCANEIPHLTALDLLVEQDRPAAAQAIAKVFAEGEAAAELQLLSKGGRKTPYFFTGRRLEFDGQTGFLGVGLDITDRKQVDLELTALRDQLASELTAMHRLHEVTTRFLAQEDLPVLLEATLDAAIAITGASKGNIQLLDPASGELAIGVQRGFDQAFVEFFSHIHPSEAACGTAMQSKQCVIVEDVTLSPIFLAQPRALEFKLAAGIRAITCTPLLPRAGQLVGVLSVHFPMPHRPSDRDLRLLDLLARQAADFIERAQAEAALRESELFYRQTLESIPGMVFTTRPDGYCDYQSQQWVEFTGIPMSEHLGDGWNHLLHPEDCDRAYAVWRAAVEVGAEYDLEYRVRRHDRVYRWFKVRGRPIRDAEGRIVRWFGVALDIEALKQAEAALQKTRDDLAQTNAHLEHLVLERTAKLRETVAELEGFSYSLVHDMRAPLRAMLSYAGILELEAGERFDPEHSDLLRKIKLAARRMDQLITDSFNYSRILRQDLPLGPVNLGSLLRGMVETYPNLQPPQADVSIELDDVVVHGNQAALTQIFSNLLGNAVKFVAPGVRPRIRVWSQPSTNDHQPSLTHVLVWVEDNGIGIPKDQHEKIFGMFQRMHRSDEYPGTGIGLALVRKSLERTGGQVCLDSEPGKGSRFCIELPLAAQNSEKALSE